MKALLFIIFIMILIPTVQAGERITNGDFESGLSGWTGDGTGLPEIFYVPYSGSKNIGISGAYGDTEHTISQNVDFTDVDVLTIYLRTYGNVIPVGAHFDIYVDGDTVLTVLEGGGLYTRYEIDVSGYTGYNSLVIAMTKNPTGSYILYADNVSAISPIHKIYGYVKNNIGNSVSSATITLNNSGGSTTSNDTGYYAITGISSGTYSITATSPTHQDYSDTVSITDDTEKNITMTRLTPALSNVGIIDSSESTLRIGWRENAVVDSVRIYQGTNTNLIATEDTSYVSLASYTVGNLDADTGYNFWLEPWDNTISGSKYYVSGTTDGDGGGGGGGGPISDPTPRPTTTPSPTAPPWTNITDEDWLNLTRYEQEYILFEHDQLNITIGTYTPKPVNLSFWYLILFLGICSTAYGSQKKNGEVLFVVGLVVVFISMIKLGLF